MQGTEAGPETGKTTSARDAASPAKRRATRVETAPTRGTVAQEGTEDLDLQATTAETADVVEETLPTTPEM